VVRDWKRQVNDQDAGGLHRDPRGHEPVDAFIESLDRAPAQVAIDNAIDLLNGLSPSAPPLAFPHSSQLVGELRELRAHYGRTPTGSCTGGQAIS
jgi:hypothetical protein